MNKLSEYLHLISRGIPNADKILDGIIKNVQLKHNNLPENEKYEIIKRRIKCEECPFNSRNAKTSPEYMELYGEHYKTHRAGFHCSACGCPIPVKTASLDSECGLQVYNNDHPDNIQELKWNKYN
jgi:3'-phosphoadenosine 5'-phosphosulfate sulfotransferase (PAPS reductase)/FAD synthetase